MKKGIIVLLVLMIFSLTSCKSKTEKVIEANIKGRTTSDVVYELENANDFSKYDSYKLEFFGTYDLKNKDSIINKTTSNHYEFEITFIKNQNDYLIDFTIAQKVLGQYSKEMFGIYFLDNKTYVYNYSDTNFIRLYIDEAFDVLSTFNSISSVQVSTNIINNYLTNNIDALTINVSNDLLNLNKHITYADLVNDNLKQYYSGGIDLNVSYDVNNILTKAGYNINAKEKTAVLNKNITGSGELKFYFDSFLVSSIPSLDRFEKADSEQIEMLLQNSFISILTILN